MKKYDFSFATYTDTKDIMDLLYPTYFNESIYRSLDYDPVSTAAYISTWINEHCVIARYQGKVVGIIAFYFTNTYYRQKECDIVIFYIHPDHRGTVLSRALVKALDDICKREGDVGVAYTTSASGMEGSNDSLYRNLFKKFGYKVLGTEMIKVFDNE